MKSLLLILALFSTNAFALTVPTSVAKIEGDWVSAGTPANDSDQKLYLPAYDWAYDCTLRVTDSNVKTSADPRGPYLQTGETSFQLSSGKRTFRSAEGTWTWWKFFRDANAAVLGDRPFDAAPTDAHFVHLLFHPGKMGQVDEVSVVVVQKMPVGLEYYKVSQGDGFGDRNSPSLEARVKDKLELQKTNNAENYTAKLSATVSCRKVR